MEHLRPAGFPGCGSCTLHLQSHGFDEICSDLGIEKEA